MSRLFIGLSLGLLGLVGMGLGGALDATPMRMACQGDCATSASTPIAVAECRECPPAPGDG